MTNDRLMTIREFADAVRLSETTIRRHIRNGDIEVLRYSAHSVLQEYGQPVRIMESEIEPFIKKVYTRFKGDEIQGENNG